MARSNTTPAPAWLGGAGAKRRAYKHPAQNRTPEYMAWCALSNKPCDPELERHAALPYRKWLEAQRVLDLAAYGAELPPIVPEDRRRRQ